MYAKGSFIASFFFRLYQNELEAHPESTRTGYSPATRYSKCSMFSVCFVAKSAASTYISPLSLHIVNSAPYRALHAHSTARFVSLAVICTTWIIHETFLCGSTYVDRLFSGARVTQRCTLISPFSVNLSLS